LEEYKELQEEVAILDGMALLYTYHKSNSVKTCRDFSESFSKWIDEKFSNYSEVHVVFDSLKKNSKQEIRLIRQKGSDPIQYKIGLESTIESTPMNKLLAHDKTKDEQTEFLSDQIVKFSVTNKNKLAASCRDKAISSQGADVSSLSSNQDEADTKIILHAAYLAQR
jgi:hypothetical protein